MMKCLLKSLVYKKTMKKIIQNIRLIDNMKIKTID